MAEHSGFFDANYVDGKYDRVYLADDFAKYYRSFISDGFFRGTMGELEVLQKDEADMSIKVATGQGFIKGYFYENDEELSLPIENADGTLNRIDIVILRLNMAQRSINLAIKKGTPATNPSHPDLTRTEDVYELKLADIYVNAGMVNIAQNNIVDTRLITDYCGMVTFVGEGNISGMTSDIEKLKMIAIESTPYPGCFYRVVNNEIEWLNPPYVIGVEYKLVERWKNKPVYVRTIYTKNLPASGSQFIKIMTPEENFKIDDVISIEGHASQGTLGVEVFQFPILSTDTIPSAFISKVFKSTGEILIAVTQNLSTFESYITIKYTKK